MRQFKSMQCNAMLSAAPVDVGPSIHNLRLKRVELEQRLSLLCNLAGQLAGWAHDQNRDATALAGGGPAKPQGGRENEWVVLWCCRSAMIKGHPQAGECRADSWAGQVRAVRVA